MNMPAEGLARYGLKTNPYQVRPLDPLTREEKLGKAIGVVGGLSPVEDYIERAAEANETAFVLVQGKSGTGRTTVCNHLLRHHCDVRQISPANYVVPKTRFSGQDSFSIFREWTISLHGKLRSARLTPLGDEVFDLDRALSQPATLDPGTFATQAAELMAELANVLDTKSAGFGGCFENVKDFRLVNAAFEAFAEARTLILMTVLDYPRTRDSIRMLYERHNPEASSVDESHYPILDLETIRGEVAKDLIQFHWTCAVPDLESPFDDHSLVKAFDDQARPAGRIVKLTREVLNLRVEMVGSGPPWPDDRDNLMIKHEVLCGLVPRVDDLVPQPTDD